VPFRPILPPSAGVVFYLVCKKDSIRFAVRVKIIIFAPHLTTNLFKQHHIMKISRIEHLGIAVQSIDEVLPYFQDVLGLEVYKTEVVEDQKVKTAFLKVGEVKLELLEPTCPESTVQKYLDNGGRGVHHVAFKVEDGVSEALAMCDEKGIRLIDKAPRKGADGLHIAFLHPKSTCGILTELCEE
jgi:methylmalonyl-CoA/ethylmalonyl-CoA epimerase